MLLSVKVFAYFYWLYFKYLAVGVIVSGVFLKLHFKSFFADRRSAVGFCSLVAYPGPLGDPWFPRFHDLVLSPLALSMWTLL